MSKENPSLKKVAAFFEGKGFYLILFLCVAAIGVSGIMMNAEKKAEEEQLRLEQQMEDYLNLPDESEVVEDFKLTIPDTGEDIIEFQSDEGNIPELKTSGQVAAKENSEPVSAKAEKVTVKQETVFVNPVAGEIINAFSLDELVYDPTFEDWRTHNGIDFSAQPGERVMAIADGTVESISHDEMYGTVLVIAHSDGVKTTYFNLMPNVLVSEGDNVSVNEVIGGLGSEALFENGDEFHLHVEVTRDGVTIDPTEILQN